MDRDGLPFVICPLIVAAIFSGVGVWFGAVFFVVFACALGLFFRDPERTPPEHLDAKAVLAPADGRVLHVGKPQPSVAPVGSWLQVSIFLSPLDVHINRTPVGGKVVDVTYRPGRFLAAFNERSAQENERSEIQVESDGQLVIFRQVVGLLARRVVCRIKPGMVVERGQRFGIMKFGSRMDVFMPADSTIAVKVGDVVRGGETVLGNLVNMK
jgi:phosphatidylserine decarboxylase